MKYLVIECHPGYAVVLDEAGRFLKVANLHYTVGQRVTSVVEIRQPPAARERTAKSRRRAFLPIISLAACFCLVVLGSWQYLLTPYGSVRMQINPDVQMTVNYMDYVLTVEDLNEDGQELIYGYRYRLKKLDRVSDELVNRAVEAGYLKEGGNIRLIMESDHESWWTATEERILIEPEVHMGNFVTIIPVRADAPPENEVAIPAQLPTQTPDNEYLDDAGDEDWDRDASDEANEDDEDLEEQEENNNLPDDEEDSEKQDDDLPDDADEPDDSDCSDDSDESEEPDEDCSSDDA